MNLEDQRTNCPGFLDEYGIWNNGFECPSLSNQIRICCGSDSRRYCCTLATRSATTIISQHDKSTSTVNNRNLSFFSLNKFFSNGFSLPIILSFIFVLVLLLIFIVIRCRCRRERSSATQQTLRVDPPLFSRETKTNPPQTIANCPSEIYFQDWKEFFVNSDQPMNFYPTISSSKERSFLSQEDIFV